MAMSLDSMASTVGRPAGQFHTTHWSVVQAAGDGDSPVAQEALERLCRAYWYPLYAFARRRGWGGEDAQDLTQAFFAQLLAKDSLARAQRGRGRFRTFLLSSFQNFLADAWDRSQAHKRGGGQSPIALDALDAEERYRLEPVDPMDAARWFDRRWATTLISRALERLQAEQAARGRQRLCGELKPYLVAEPAEGAYAGVAQRLGMTEGAVRMAVLRLRERYREVLREEILETVSSAADAEEEYRALLAALVD